jgi:hypothetical protein
MKKIICTQNWWSVGENLGTINQALTLINFLKSLFPNELYFILNFLDNKFIIENCINIDEISIIPDEIFIENYDYSVENLRSNGYVSLIPNFHFYCKEDEFEILNLLKFEYDGIEMIGISNAVNLWIDHAHSHHLNRIRHFINVLNSHDFIPHNKGHNCYVDLNKNINEKIEFILNNNNINKFDSVFFRWEGHRDGEIDESIIESYVEGLIPHLNFEKLYFLSSNYRIFYKIFEKYFPNCFYIDRGKYYIGYKEYKSNEPYVKFNNNKKEYILEDDDIKQTGKIMSDYIAHIELSFICKSSKIIYITDSKRNNISLFIWLPILKYSIPIEWFNFDLSKIIFRQYNFDNCISEKTIDL